MQRTLELGFPEFPSPPLRLIPLLQEERLALSTPEGSIRTIQKLYKGRFKVSAKYIGTRFSRIPFSPTSSNSSSSAALCEP